MTIKDWMSPNPVTVAPTASIARAQEMMVARRIRHLPVVQDGRLVGILSDRDVRTVLPSPATSFAVRELRYLLDRLKVSEVMTRSVVTVAPEEPIGEAARLLVENRFGSLPVVAGGRLVGMLVDSVSDILQVDDAEIRNLPEVNSTLARDFLKQVVVQENRIICEIALDRIVPQIELEAA